MERINGTHGGGAGGEVYRQVLEEAATQMGTVGPRIFREIKLQLMRNEQIPAQIREMGESQIWVLHNLLHGRKISSELAARHNVANPTMTRIIDSLVREGYVRREHDPSDRRCIFLELTEEGKDLGGVVQRIFRNAIAEFLSPLSSEQLADIVRAYQHLATLLESKSPEVERHGRRRSQIAPQGTPGLPGTRGRSGRLHTFGRHRYSRRRRFAENG